MSIVFLTLFLGLVNGSGEVKLEAHGPVAAIQILLDGHEVARIPHAPWTTRVDFGKDILPHHLQAVALQADGGEVARAEQWINLPRPPAEVEIAMKGTGARRRVRLRWQSLTGQPPSEVSLSLDGKPLDLDAQEEAEVNLPSAGDAHVLTAELHFPFGAVARKDLVLTGDWGSDVATELTAIPVRRHPGDKPLAAKDLQGRLTDGGRPVVVSTVDQEPPQIYVVRSDHANLDLTRMVMSWHRIGSGAGWAGYGDLVPDPRLHFHLVAPVPQLYHQSDTGAEVFEISPDIVAPKKPLLYMLMTPRFKLPSEPVRTTDAVAVAGLQALGRQTPRAVVLILGFDPDKDVSVFFPPTVRAYLASIGVPLYVWSLAGATSELKRAWGEVEDIRLPPALREAYKRLETDVLSQQVVWLEGRHLPQAIQLAPTEAAAGAAAGPELLPHLSTR